MSEALFVDWRMGGWMFIAGLEDDDDVVDDDNGDADGSDDDNGDDDGGDDEVAM